MHCKISVFHCKIFVLHCKISVLHCKISGLHCKISVLHCKISVLHCKISFLHCKISVLDCKISVLHCKISVLHCKMYCCSLLLLPLIEPVLDMHRSSQCFRNLQGYQVPRRDEASNTKLLHSFSLFLWSFRIVFFYLSLQKRKTQN